MTRSLALAWFTPPVDFEEVKERIGLNDEYEEYAIHDYELPFEIDEYTPVDEVNRLCEMVEDLPEYIQEELSALQSYFGSIEELCEHEDDIICHSGCDDMADVARYYLEESGQLGELPAHLQNYIDYEAYGRDMELEGTFVVTNHGVFTRDCPLPEEDINGFTTQGKPIFSEAAFNSSRVFA